MARKKTTGNDSGQGRAGQADKRTLILDKAAELFYRQGYVATGVQEILDAAGASPPTLYHHFGSKHGLALAYLDKQERQNLKVVGVFARRRDMDRFIADWTAMILRAIRRGDFYGCPFSNFSREIPDGDDPGLRELRATVNGIMERWVLYMEEFLKDLKKSGAVRKDADTGRAARRFLTLYQGALAMWSASGDLNYIRHLKQDLTDLADSIRQNPN